MGERHGFADRLDNPGAHDLIGRLRHLPRAAAADVGHRLAHFFQDRLGAIENGFIPAAHDGERCGPCAFDAAADRAIEESHAERVELGMDVALGIFSNRGAIHDDHVRRQSRFQARDDLPHILVCRHADYDGFAITRKLG